MQDKEGKTFVHHAVINNRRKVLGYLVSENADLDYKDNDGNTPLHYACELDLKELILFLLINKADYNEKNNLDKLPGEDNPDISIFIGNISDEEKCFKILSPEQIKKLTSIFKDIDYDKTKKIDMKKSIAFNHFIDNKISKNGLTRDAEDFIEEVALINNEDVSLDEWLYSFSKLLYCDKKIFEKFMNEYDEACNQAGGCFSEIMTSKEDDIL